MKRNIKLAFHVEEGGEIIQERSQIYLVIDEAEMADLVAKSAASVAPLPAKLVRERYVREMIEAGMIVVQRGCAMRVVEHVLKENA